MVQGIEIAHALDIVFKDIGKPETTEPVLAITIGRIGKRRLVRQ